MASASITIAVKDPPAPPTVSVSIQPTCYVPTGTVKVSSPIGANYLYSLDGGSYTSVTTFDKLAAGSSHSIKVKDISTGCESVSTPITINPIPSLLLTPVVDITASPTCIVPTGTIKVTDPKEGTGFDYSLDGTPYQASAVFKGLAPGSSHTVRVRDLLTGCESGLAPLVMNPITNPPVAPTLTVVAPTCIIPTGTIIVADPNVGTGIRI